MIINVDGLELNYEVYGRGKKVLLLHGWGLNLHSFDSIIPILSENFQVIALDLPGFGLSSKLKEPLGTLDFAYGIEKFLDKLDIRETMVLGHSFGGAVAIALCSFSSRITKLILEDSAGLYPKGLLTQLKILLYKIWRRVLPFSYLQKNFKNLFGSKDYKEAGRLRQTLIRVVNQNINYLLPRINIPTLIIWGEKDEVTSKREARVLNTGIKNSSILILRGCSHFPHLEKPAEFTQAITDFLIEN